MQAPRFLKNALELLHQQLGRKTKSAISEDEAAVELDAATAVATIEALLCECAGTSMTSTSSQAAQAWIQWQRQHCTNIFDRQLSTLEAEHSSGALTCAMGAALSGRRSTAFLSADELQLALPTLARAARRSIPLVIHVEGASEHSLMPLLASTGCIFLTAATVQQVVDQSIVGRMLAEQVLLPVIVFSGNSLNNQRQPVQLPKPTTLRSLLSDSSSPLRCENASQRLVFGEQRRMIPKQHDLDRPVAVGGGLHASDQDLANAARQAYVYSSVEAGMQQVADKFKQSTGRQQQAVKKGLQGSNTDLVLVGCGSMIPLLKQAAQAMSASTETAQATSPTVQIPAVLELSTLLPLPVTQVVTLLGSARKILVFEAVDPVLNSDGPLCSMLRAELARQLSGSIDLCTVICGQGEQDIQGGDIQLMITAALAHFPSESQYLGLEFRGADSKLPKRQALLDQLDRYYPTLDNCCHQSRKQSSQQTSDGTKSAPNHRSTLAFEALDTSAKDGQGYDSLARLYEQVVQPQERGERPTADPYRTLDILPARSSLLQEAESSVVSIAMFDAASFDGRGDLWTQQASGQFVATAVNSRDLLDTGIRLAKKAGLDASFLTRHLSNISKQMNALARAVTSPLTATELLGQAFDKIAQQSGMQGEALQNMQQASTAIGHALADLPLARTAAFFDQAEELQADSGEFVVIVRDPLATDDTAACSRWMGQGLRLELVTEQLQQRIIQQWEVWLQLPEISGKSLARVAQHPDIGPLAACLMARSCAFSMIGGDQAEADSGDRLALRHLFAISEARLQPEMQKLVARLDKLHGQLESAVSQLLASALPTANLDSLASALQATNDQEPLELVDLLGKLSPGTEAETLGEHRLDSARLNRLIEVTRKLAAYRSTLVQGPSGLGRARYGLTLVEGRLTSWLCAHSCNPFSVPVLIEAGRDAAHAARGLLDGQLAEQLYGLRLLRWAQLELDEPNKVATELEKLGTLNWQQLTAEERASCAPVLLVGDEKSLGAACASQLCWLLSSDLPIKIFIVGESGGFGDSLLENSSEVHCIDSSWLALSTQQAYVAQSSVANSEHLYQSITGALQHGGPALVSIHAPSPARHGYPVGRTLEMAQLAIDSRAHTLFRYDPRTDAIFGRCFDLTGNPANNSAAEAEASPLDWALQQSRFDHHFQTLDNTSAPTSSITFAEYLKLNSRERQSKTVTVTDGEGQVQSVSESLLRDCELRMHRWTTLQELAGVVTPFTDRVKEATTVELNLAHAEELQQLRQQHQSELDALHRGQEGEFSSRLQSRLLALAGYAAAGSSKPEQNGEGEHA